MARMRYFCDLGPGPEPVPLQGVWPMANSEFAQRFPGVAGLRADGYSRWVGYPLEGPGSPLPVTRRIVYKAQPSRHECNAKCLHELNKVLRECGGKVKEELDLLIYEGLVAVDGEDPHESGAPEIFIDLTDCIPVREGLVDFIESRGLTVRQVIGGADLSAF